MSAPADLTNAGPSIAQFSQCALQALRLWPVQVERLEPIKVRENAVFAVHLRGGGKLIVRVHRLGYHSDEALVSEHAWSAALAAQGIAVPKPRHSQSGRLFEHVEIPGLTGPRQVDVFEWIDGRQLGTCEQGLALDAGVASTYRTIGEIAARIHNAASAWQVPTTFRRHAWDEAGLVGSEPFWGRFWELAALTREQQRLFERLRDCAAEDLHAFGKTADRFSMIHADLVPENVLVTSEGLRVIDFDDAGFGWHMFEMSTSLYFIRREPYYEDARQGFISGYRRVRPLTDEQIKLLPLFLAVRGSTYLGWAHTRKGELVAAELTPMLVALAEQAARDYLSAGAA